MSVISGAAGTNDLSTAKAWQHKVDRCQNGVLWAAFASDNGSWGQARFHYSTDNGATWTLVPSMDAGGLWDGRAFSFFIDQDDYMHIAWHASSGTTYYSRATPNPSRTSYTWGAGGAQQISLSVDDFYNTPDVVAWRAGTGWTAVVVASYFNKTDGTPGTSYITSWVINIDSAGTISTPIVAEVMGATSTDFRLAVGIDFQHNGDGKTSANGADPAVFIGFAMSPAGATQGVQFRKGTRSGATYAYGTQRAIDTTRWLIASSVDDNYRWINVFYDGTRVVITGCLWDATNLHQLMIYERDLADTTTTTRTLLTGQNGQTVVIYQGAAAWDSLKNIWYVMAGQSPGGSTNTWGWRKWTRATTTLGSLTTIGTGLKQLLGFSARRGSAGTRMDWVYHDGSFRNFQLVEPIAPTTPTLSYPISSTLIDRTVVQRFTWTHNDPNGDAQDKYDFQYRVVGSGTWTTVNGVVSANQYRDVAANTFTNATNYEWQVRTYDAGGLVSPYSASGFFTAQTTPTTPTAITPVNNGTIDANPYLVQWGTGASAQYSYQIDFFYASNNEQWDSTGEVVSSTKSRSVAFPNLTGIYMKIKYRSVSGGIWSNVLTVNATVAYNVPANPTITTTFTDPFGIGVNTAMSIAIVNPTPVGSQVPVVTQAVWAREVGDPGGGTLLKWDSAPSSPVIWYAPKPETAYEIRTYSSGSNQLSAFSPWTPATGVLKCTGFLVHDPLLPSGVFNITMNDSGASERVSIEATTMQYQGREFPVVEFGDGTTKSIDVGLVYADAGQEAKIKAIMLTRRIVCYRDHKGRKVFGYIPDHEEEDTFWGKKSKFSLVVVDYEESYE